MGLLHKAQKELWVTVPIVLVVPSYHLGIHSSCLVIYTFSFSVLYVQALFYSLEVVNLTIFIDKKYQKSLFAAIF